MWFVFGLTSFHTYLVFSNKTTNEYLKKTWKYPSFNPFFRGVRKNIFSVCRKKPK